MCFGGGVLGGLVFLIGLILVFIDHISFPWLVVFSLLIFIFYAFIYGRTALEGELETEIRRRMNEQKRYSF
jgi:hypothetical protein